jgi:streptogramin lyase
MNGRFGGRVLHAGLLALLAATEAHGVAFQGRVGSPTGEPVVGAMVTVASGDPAHAITVFSEETGRYHTPELGTNGPFVVRVRRIGWRDLRRVDVEAPAGDLDWVLERETDPAEVAAQLPAHRWYALALERVDDPQRREELKRQCTFCHQQGNWATRRLREPEEWRKVVALMGRMGGMVGRELRETIPTLFNEVYDPDYAVPRLTAGMGEPGFAPPPPPEVRRAVIEEWDLGGRASMQHDVVYHPGQDALFSVDMAQDQLYRLDPRAPGGARKAWDIPNEGNLPLGGAFRSKSRPLLPNTNSHVGPHSIQVAPDGRLWITLANGNRLAGFDPTSGEWTIHTLDDGYYPHTLRFDARGRIWYTIAASNHVGLYDPASGESREIRLPTASFGQALTTRMLPALLWIGRYVDLRGMASETEEVTTMPVPYGIDVAPDGGVWFSQLNEHRIGRVDPDDFSVEIVETPFPAPRRLRFDSKGTLWIPSFSDSLVASFDPQTRAFREWKLPLQDALGETPYALHVDRRSDAVWICGTNSDSLIRFEPATERFTVYPLPTRVTYMREIDFDERGRVWTSNSNSPAWQIEGGVPKVIRLDPEGGAATVAQQRVE